MTASILEGALKETLRSYWRQKVALKLFLLNRPSLPETIEYLGLPSFGIATSFLVKEETNIALESIEKNLEERVPRDLFLSLLADFESFLSEAIISCGLTPSGTLGNLQTVVQRNYIVNQGIIEKFDEIRERRNTLIHDHGVTKQKYVDTANKVILPPWVEDPSTLTEINVNGDYLCYTVDCLVQYARQVRPT